HVADFTHDVLVENLLVGGYRARRTLLAMFYALLPHLAECGALGPILGNGNRVFTAPDCCNDLSRLLPRILKSDAVTCPETAAFSAIAHSVPNIVGGAAGRLDAHSQTCAVGDLVLSRLAVPRDRRFYGQVVRGQQVGLGNSRHGPPQSWFDFQQIIA